MRSTWPLSERDELVSAHAYPRRALDEWRGPRPEPEQGACSQRASDILSPSVLMHPACEPRPRVCAPASRRPAAIMVPREPLLRAHRRSLLFASKPFPTQSCPPSSSARRTVPEQRLGGR
ncbi:hypothetical protein MTO96_015993 [Rhipicephalus appendiculatus]